MVTVGCSPEKSGEDASGPEASGVAALSAGTGAGAGVGNPATGTGAGTGAAVAKQQSIA